MHPKIRRRSCYIFVIHFCIHFTYTQTVLTDQLLNIYAIQSTDGVIHLKEKLPLVSFQEGSDYNESNQLHPHLEISYLSVPAGLEIKFSNVSLDTILLKNILPLGIRPDHTYITGLGNHTLSRTHLFLPGRAPVNVIVPDNAWNLGYTSLVVNDSINLYALTRRISSDKSLTKRFETIVYPGGSVTYAFYTDTFSGEWQQGLKKCFQQKKLYDVQTFDDAMYKRPDLKWIQEAKMMHLIMGWDDRLYDAKKRKYVLNDFIVHSKKWYGGDDVIGIWPTWPALGLDQRNQWDMYRDMPGGYKGLRTLVDQAHHHGVKIFISYNPWDEASSKEDHLKGMADLVKTLDADGVVIDTRGASSKEMQAAVDKVKQGVILYSEGMAVPKDMVTTIAGRVHNALYYPPILNLNKLIQPDFGIFRVAEVFKEPIRREIHSALFNGYGIEFNIFHPGNPDGLDLQYQYLGKALRVLREHTAVFNSTAWNPLYPTLIDSIYINHWPGAQKDVYTVFNYRPSGFTGPLFFANKMEQRHWVDLWNHEEMQSSTLNEKEWLSCRLDPYPATDQGTNNEGSMGVVARFDHLISMRIFDGDSLAVSAAGGTHILIWPGNPEYTISPHKISTALQRLRLHELFPKHDSKFVLQLFDGKELIDERIIPFEPSTPFKISSPDFSRRIDASPEMVLIPADTFTWNTSQGDGFIPYPSIGVNKPYQMTSFYIDRHPVTNSEYQQFIKKSNYIPKDKTNYLKHWLNGKIPYGHEQHPVIYVSTEDAYAYCLWSGKRLPTELEWQYAAQTAAQWTWPWGQEAGITAVQSEVVTETLTHIQFDSFDSTLANPGNGVLDPVGHYPRGKNPYGLTDLVGSVWQMTADQYRSGAYHYVLLKGGSYYKPTSSWWYVQGGPRPLTWRQMLLLLSPGFERSGTVGFRCVRDVKWPNKK